MSILSDPVIVIHKRKSRTIPTKLNDIFFAHTSRGSLASQSNKNVRELKKIIMLANFISLLLISLRNSIIYLRLIDYINFAGHWSNNPWAIWFCASDSVQWGKETIIHRNNGNTLKINLANNSWNSLLEEDVSISILCVLFLYSLSTY